MNIFVLDVDPVLAAQFQCDKHVVKMTLETAQLLCSVFDPGIAPYKRTHYNHPCSIWARSSESNYLWLLKHGMALANEYTRRYNKITKTQAVIEWCGNNILPCLKDNDITPFAQAMPDEYKDPDPVKAYRNYYLGEKSRFAKWKLGAPDWWKNEAKKKK